MSEAVLAGEPSRPSAYTLKSPCSPPEQNDTEAALANVKGTIRRRILRRQLIGAPDLFGKRAWEMLIDVFIDELEGKLLAMSWVFVTAGIPMSSATASQRLVDEERLRRAPDHVDGRRSFMRLAPEVALRMRVHFGKSAK